MSQHGRAFLIWLILLPLQAAIAQEPENAPGATHVPLLLAHYMPWFEAKPVGPQWGWHWTMNAFDPEKSSNGRREIASHFQPLIGPYDSGDPAVLEFHLLTMKLAGIDGVIVDWYGLQDFNDYALLHRNTQRLVENIERLGMKFAVCYEDQTIPALVKAGQLKMGGRVEHATRELTWMAEHWYPLKSYVRVDGQPVLLSFGQTGLTDDEWSQVFKGLGAPVAYFSLHHRRTAAVGAFDWPIPNDASNAIERFRTDSRTWPHAIPIAFPRFVDIYAEAKVSSSFGRVADDSGKMFRSMLERAFTSKPPLVQIATWNDWGEGTMIEPSVEFGYRDLEIIQKLRREQVSRFPATARDLRLPLRLLERRRASATAEESRKLDGLAELVRIGNLKEAWAELK